MDPTQIPAPDRGRHSATGLGAIAARAAVAILVVALAACARRPLAQQAAAPDPANQQRIAAMFTIHAYAYWPDGVFPEGLHPPMSLEQATAFLNGGDSDRFADSRRRRAIGKLAAYGLGRTNIDTALHDLGADPHYITTELELARATPPCRPGSACTQGTALSPPQKETLVDDLYFGVSAPACPWKSLQAVAPVLGPPVTSTAVTIWVPPPLDQVTPALDPQSWSRCSKFFKQSYLAKRDSSGAIVADSPVPPGTPYGQTGDSRTLFEFFTCDGSGQMCWFQNMLSVMTWDETAPTTTATCPLVDSPASRYNIYYSLSSPIGGAIVGVKNTIRVDQGEGCAQDDSGGTVAYISKTLEVNNPVSNGIYQGIASVTFAEMGEEFAEILCCGMTPAPGSN